MEKTLIVIGLILLAGSIYNLHNELETKLISQFDNY